jgi:hypothetical protein
MLQEFERSNRLVIWIGFLSLISYLFLSFIFFPESIDDAYITLRFSQNLLNGYGLVFNPSEYVEGYSNLSWVLLLAVSGKLGIPMDIAMKVLSLIAGLATLTITYLCTKNFFNNVKWGVTPVLMLATSSFFVLWAVDGLETIFYTMLLTLLLYFIVINDKHPIKISLLLGVILLTRPEGVLFSAVAICLCYYRVNFIYASKLAITVGCIFLIQLIFRWYYYHEVVANTALHKLSPGIQSIRSGIIYLLEFNKDCGYLIFPLALIGILHSLFTKKPGFILVLFLLAQLIFLLVSGGDYMYGYRFIIPILPGLFMLTTLGLQTLLSKLPNFLQTLMIGLFVFWSSLIQFNSLPHKTIRINNLTYRSSPHFLIGRYLKENAKNEDRVLLSEAGVIPYYSGLNTIDYLGLVSHYKKIYYNQYPQVEVLLAEKPRFVILSFWKNKNGTEQTRMEVESLILKHPDFYKNYYALKDFKMNKNDSFLNAIYYKYWPDADVIFFRLYEKNSYLGSYKSS